MKMRGEDEGEGELQRIPRFHFFGEPLGLILGAVHERLEYAQSAKLSIAGAESNVAIGLARLGHSCVFHTALGADPYGERIMRTLRAEKIDVSSVAMIPGAVTGLITRNCFPWREPDVFYHRGFSAFSTYGEAVASEVEFAPGEVLFTTGITMSLGEASKRAVAGLVGRAREAGAVVCVDVNHRRKLWDEAALRQAFRSLYSKIDILFLSREEGRILTRLTSLSAMAEWILRRGVREVIVKDGAKGAWYFTSRSTRLYGKAFCLKEIIDPIGAGDAFNAGFLWARAEGQSRSDCLRSGNALGALVCLTPGDWESLPVPGELKSFMEGDVVASR